MFLGWIYQYLIIAIIAALLLAYNIYCFIGLYKLGKNLKHDGIDSAKNTSSKFNIYTWLVKRTIKSKGKSSELKLKLKIRLAKKIDIGAITLSSGLLIINIVLIAAIYLLNIQATNIANVLTTIFGDKDCCCYAKCTGNEEDDSKTAYELLFGPDEYKKLYDSIVLMPSEKQPFLDMHKDNPNGKTEGEWLIAHLDDNAVQCYKNIVGNNSKFRSGDHQDRSKMTNAELKDDLIALLKDYKVEGRNPNCDRCTNTTDLQLGKKCIGEAHYVEGWTWEAIWDSDNPGDGTGGDDEGGGIGGGGNTSAQNSIYGVNLGDGWYYWYHQAQELCNWNVAHPTYGRYGSLYLGKGTASSRGCSTYSTAMAVANVLNKEITPYNILDAIGGSFSQTENGWTYTSDKASSGIDLNDNAVGLNKNVLANRLSQAYGSDGLQTECFTLSQQKVDEILSKGGMVILSFTTPKWEWYQGDGSHYEVIRRKDENGLYYALNSCASDNNFSLMTTGVTWSNLFSHKTHADAIGVWNINPPSSGGGGGPIILPVEAEKVRQALQGTEFADKADALAYAYSVVQPTLGVNAAIGLMANVASEGNFGVVEHAFSVNKPYGFSLPSGGTIVKTMNDVEYLKAWDSTTTTGSPKKGSCGFGCVQWSYDRRVTLANIYISMSQGSITEELKMTAEIQMMATELSPGTGYYNNVSSAANKAGGSPEKWAEAFCDYYEMPGGWCGKNNRMSGTGSGCIARMQVATRLTDILSYIN